MIASRSPAAFKQPDILVARRIADRMTVTLARDREVANRKSRAAKALGLTRHQLYIRMRRHGLAE